MSFISLMSTISISVLLFFSYLIYEVLIELHEISATEMLLINIIIIIIIIIIYIIIILLLVNKEKN